MVSRSIEYRSDEDFRTHKKWRRYEKISPEMAKAVIASEDNLFAEHNGFDWKEIGPALDKLSEEVEELKKAVADNSNVEEELGDLLFATINVARMNGLSPDNALERTNQKFIRRFNYVEEGAIAQGQSLKEMTLEAMDALWDEAKSKGL